MAAPDEPTIWRAIAEAWTGAAGAQFGALIGRVLWVLDPRGNRPPTLWRAAYELMVVVAAGFVADGIGDYLDLRPGVTVGLACALAWLGPHGLRPVIGWLADRYSPRPPNGGL